MGECFIFLTIYTAVCFKYTGSSNYLDYLFSLNYWSSNTLFILSFIVFFIPVFSAWVYFFFLKFCVMFKVTVMFFSKKLLVDALYVGTLTIHPLLFYFSLIILGLKVFFPKNFYQTGLRNLHFSRLIWFLSLTLLLGGFWGFQSTIWGYFWVNDMVELLLLLAIFYSVWYLHKIFCLDKFWNRAWFFCLTFNLILVVRLNLIPTRHNFIQSSSLYAIIFALYFFFLVNLSQIQLRRLRLIISLPTLLVILVCYSSLPLVKSFSWVYFLFFLARSTSRTFLHNFYLHFLLILFFSVWNIYFTYFFILYGQFQNLYTNLTIYAQQLIISSKQSICLPRFKELEGVDFLTLTNTIRIFRFTFEVSCFVLLNNAPLVALSLLYFFVKMVELRLLHATKTFNEKPSPSWNYVM